MVLSKYGISVDEIKIQVFKNLTKPEDMAELRSFLGLAIYLGDFMPNFAGLVDPLQKLLRKGQNWEWGDEQNCAFKLLKESLENKKIITD